MSSSAPMAATPYDHDLKVWPGFFRPLCDGTKTFELRKNDRNYRVGDILKLREYDPDTECYTGTVCERRVCYIESEAAGFGLEDGYAVLGLEPVVAEQSELCLCAKGETMTESRPGHYWTAGGVLHRWRPYGLFGYTREFSSQPGEEWRPTGYVSLVDIETDYEALEALVAYEQEERQDWVRLGASCRCLRDGTRPQRRRADGFWEDDTITYGPDFPSLVDVYRIGYENGKEER